MNCKKLHNKLIFYLGDDLPQKEMEQVKVHLSECTECAAFADDMKKTLGILEAEKLPEVNPFFYTRLKAKMEAQTESFETASANPVWTKILQPAMFSILLFIGIYSGIKIGEKAETQLYARGNANEQLVPYLNEMEAEPIETFLME